MSCIIAVNSKDFIKKFCKDNNPHNFDIILVSKDITTEGRYDNVYLAEELYPSKSAFNARINAGEYDFTSKFITQLKENPNSIACLVSMVKSVLNKRNLVLICSEQEESYGILEIIAKHIEDTFKLPVYSAKDLQKKGEKLLNKTPKNEDVIKKKVLKAIDELKENNSHQKSIKEFKKLIDKMKKKRLYKMLTKFSDFDDDIEEFTKSDIQDICLQFANSLPEDKVEKLIKYLKKKK